MQKSSIANAPNSRGLRREELCQPSPQNSPLNNARVPQVMTIWQRTLCNILVHLRQRPLSQRQPASRTMRIRYPSNACRTCRAKISKPKQELTSCRITCHSRIQKHPLQQISGCQILLTNAQHTTPAPSYTKPILNNPPVRATHFTLYYLHLATRHSPVNTQRYSCQIHCSV